MRTYRIGAFAAAGLILGSLYAYVLNHFGLDGHGWLLLLLPAGAGTGALLGTGRATVFAIMVAILVAAAPAADGFVTARAIGRSVELQREAEEAVRAKAPGSDKVTAAKPANACNQVVVLTEQGGHYNWYWYNGNTGTISRPVTEEQLVRLISPNVPGAIRVTLSPQQKLPDRVDFTYEILKLNERGVAALTEGCQFRLAWITVYPAKDRTPISYYPKLSLGE